MEKQNNNRQNCAKLDYNIEHIHKVFCFDLQIDELIQQNQMAGRRHRKPLSDALHNAEENGFEKFQNKIYHKNVPFLGMVNDRLSYQHSTPS